MEIQNVCNDVNYFQELQTADRQFLRVSDYTKWIQQTIQQNNN